VRTSILYAHMLNTSMAWVSPDGSRSGDRQRPDAEQYGWSALYRLYRTAEGWLCLAALTEADWTALGKAIGRPELTTDPRFATEQSRASNDAALVAQLADIFAGRTAAEWFSLLDSHRVPCEVSDPDYVLRLFADPEAHQRQLVSSFSHPVLGNMTLGGLYFDLSDTPGVIQGPPVWPGQNSRAILGQLGYTPAEIDKLIESGTVDDTSEAK
jgi:crotonobetainyl-CoA:carnitine CoA-transferase CaiB-like acyl-CoA transferase